MIQMTIGFFNTSCFEAYQSIARGRCHVRESIYMDQARFYDLDVGTGGPCYISLKSQWLNAAASNAVEASRSYIYIYHIWNQCEFLCVSGSARFSMLRFLSKNESFACHIEYQKSLQAHSCIQMTLRLSWMGTVWVMLMEVLEALSRLGTCCPTGPAGRCPMSSTQTPGGFGCFIGEVPCEGRAGRHWAAAGLQLQYSRGAREALYGPVGCTMVYFSRNLLCRSLLRVYDGLCTLISDVRCSMFFPCS